MRMLKRIWDQKFTRETILIREFNHVLQVGRLKRSALETVQLSRRLQLIIRTNRIKFQKTMSRIGRSTKSRIFAPLLCGGSNKTACVGRSKLKWLGICTSAPGQVTCQTMRLRTSRITIIATDQSIGSQWTSGLAASASTRQQCLGWQEYVGGQKKLQLATRIPSQSVI